MFTKILVANRGEIAVRIIGAAHALGIKAVAVFSEADADALHVRLADESRCIGPASARQSYLDIDAIVECALAAGAQAVHPGYGFLSENAELASAVEAAGLTFIGPHAETMALMADKVTARLAAIAAGLPVLPGSKDAVENIGSALETAAAIGFPVAVKASFGGGGRGMRVAADAAALEAAMDAARRESNAAFGRSEIFLERYLPRPRHVEVQILGDSEGNVVHLGDRDCSVQRRYQKVVEEAPAPLLDSGLRAEIHNAALSLANSISYLGAGTIEFLIDPSTRSFFFLEMNTRLQVEHGVTEMVTGIDIVEAQIRIAAGLPLGFTQDEVRVTGHAIQARIAAEDPWDEFRPTAGTLNKIDIPLLPWTRADFGFASGDRAEPYYDSLLGKLLAWGPDRASATERLHLALRRLDVRGVPTTAQYIAEILRQPDFVACTHFTGSVEQDWAPDPANRPEAPGPIVKEDRAMDIVSERKVSLPGTPPRSVAVYGVAQANLPVAVPSGRSTRASSKAPGQHDTTAGARFLHAPMDGMLVDRRVSVGQSVREGEALLILEAMKMEVVVSSPAAGTIRRIFGEVGLPVGKGQVLIEFDEPGS